MSEYRTVITNAPDAYDYSYTVQVGIVSMMGRDYRVVQIPTTHACYQTDRYASGMHIAAEIRQS